MKQIALNYKSVKKGTILRGFIHCLVMFMKRAKQKKEKGSDDSLSFFLFLSLSRARSLSHTSPSLFRESLLRALSMTL
jgi:hypothetical protein